MAGIWQYPDLAELENFLSRLTLQSAETVSQQTRPAAAFVDGLSVRKFLVFGKWGEGTAEFGEDELKIVVFFGFSGPDNNFDDVADAVVNRMSRDIIEGRINIPQDLRNATESIEFVSANITDFNDILADMAISNLEMVFDISDSVAIDLKEGEAPDTFPRIPLENLLEDEEEEKEEADVDEITPENINLPLTTAPELPEAVIPEIPEEMLAGPEFPDINENLRPFAVTEDTLEIPAGKEEKQIEVREPFDFEQEMALPGLQTTTQIFQQTQEEIAQPIGAGTLGTQEPVGTYPRTGLYIRNYLTFRGPAYSYEIYKNLVYYSGYISTLHDINVRAGSYQTFREYMYVLERIGEEGGPALIESLTQQQAAAQGLQTVPDHPSIEGEKAPWLERRQYYDIVEENNNSEIWNNPYDYLHGDEDDS